MTYTPDELDREIIRLLQRDGRTSNVEIGRALGVAESTVRKRLERLLEDGGVRIRAFPDPQMVGLSVEALIHLQVEPASLRRVQRRLAALPEVRSLRLTTGEYQLVVEASFAAAEGLQEFLTGQLPLLEGVGRVASALVLETVKSAADWQLPGAGPSLILVVDDDPDFVETSRLVLESQGYRVESAFSGRQALERMGRATPDLVVLDVMMEDVLAGVSVSEAMREHPGLASVPVLMVSSIPDSSYAGMFPMDRHLPVDGFCTKPVSPEKLVQEVGRLLRLGRRRPAGRGEMARAMVSPGP